MRVSRVMTGLLSVALVLVISLSTGAQSLAASPQHEPAAATSQSTQGATSPAAPAQATPQAAPQTSTTPGTTPGSAQSAPQGSDDNPLNLTEEQKGKLRPILMEERLQMETLQNDASMSTEQKMAKAQQIRETAAPKIKAVLTPEQLKKLSDLQQQRAQQQNQNAPAGGTPPKQ
jgi:hypothetical protein